jgi:hypothetical protein
MTKQLQYGWGKRMQREKNACMSHFIRLTINKPRFHSETSGVVKGGVSKSYMSAHVTAVGQVSSA